MFTTPELKNLDPNKIFGDEINRPLAWHKLRLFLALLGADLSFALGHEPTIVDMADATHTIVAGPDAGAAQTAATSTLLLVDPNGGANDLILDEANLPLGTYTIVNTADAAETITVKDTSGATATTVAQNKTRVVVVWDDAGTRKLTGLDLA